jgi:hypothetical protein
MPNRYFIGMEMKRITRKEIPSKSAISLRRPIVVAKFINYDLECVIMSF